MISCAAIQKLERYGQLALKRHSVADFLQSSLKDAKRANIYALTHLPTWRSAHAAIAGAPSNNNNNSSSSPSGDASTAVVTEALLHAISHTTALLSHHIHLSLLMAATKSEKQHNTSPSTTTSSSSSAVDAILQFASDVLPVNHDDADSSSMRPWMRCASLLELLVGILATHVLRRRKTTANSGPVAATFTQAVLHLFSRVADLSMYLIALKAFMQQQQQKSVNDDDEDAVQVERCVELSLSFSAAVTQLLHASLARTSHLTAMFQHRTCGSLLGGLLSRGAARGADSAKRDDVALLDAQDANNNISTDSSMEPLLAQLLCCSTQSRSSISGGGGGGNNNNNNNNNNARAPFCAGTSFDGLTLFQRLTLLHAAWANAQRQLAPHLASRTHVLRQTIDAIISLAVSNKATRFVVYFRGDDVKLLQNDVRSPADYALHTYATTPPIDATLLEQLAAAERATNTRGGGGAMDDVWCWVGLLLTQWIVSLPCIFDGFCMNPSWAAFAQEQRRKVMVRQAQERRAAADQRRTQRRAGAATTTNRGTSSSSDGSATPEVEPRDDDDDGAMSVASVQTSASRSMRSMESRASLLSTLSKESVSSYISFISRLAPEVQEHEGAMDAPHLHESADGNTNLPLILLEEIILGLHRFEEAMPEKILQRFGLRALMWQTMGQLFAMVQQTMSTTTTTSSSSAAVPPIFHLGQDIRYNHGLGYESLGMVFAAVVAPQLEREGGRRRGDDDDEDDNAHVVNARSTLLQQHLRDAALSRCLAAYEYIAPQVVDAHLSSILHIFTRSAMKGRWLRRVSSSSSSSPSLDNVDDDGDDDVLLHDFLCGIIARLGKSNQLPLFLSAVAEQRADALIESATTHLHHNNNTSTKEGMTLMMRDVSPVQAVLCLPVVRRALTEAAAASIDPERLLGELLTLVASWGDDDGDDDDEEKKQTKQPHAGRDPRDVLLVLFLIRVVMDGVVPTSITASTLLERSTELEMHLVHTFQRHILGNDDDDDKTRFFSTNISASMRRRLALHLLQAIYHCRELTHACLQDLGMANVEEYLIMLEDTLWQVQTKVADLVGTARVADLRRVVEQDYVKKDDEDDMYRVAEDVLHHSVEVRTLLPMMMLQRLKLVRAVSVLLNMQDVGPPHDLKELVGELLQSLLISLEQQQQQQQHHHQELVDLANRITEAEWQSIVLLGKPKAVRQALTSLLISSFTTSTNVVDEVRNNNNNNNAPPAWLARCLQCVGGAVMHAVSSIFCGISEKEVLQLVGEASTTTATTTAIRNSARSLIAMLDALEHIYAIAGHVPYWPSLLEHCVAWICALGQQLLHDDDGSHQQQQHHDDDAARATRRTVMARLITFAYTCITHEPRSQEVLRRCLLNGSDAATTTTTATTHAPARKHAQGLRPSFVEAVGVPVALLTDFRTSSPTTCEEEAGATFAPQEWSFEAEVRRACGLMFGTSCSSTNNNNNNICFVEAVLVCAREACSHASPSLSNNITNNNNNTLAIATRIVALLYSAAVNATHWSARGAPTTTTKVDRSSATSFLCFVADFIEGHARSLVTDSHNDDDDEVQPHKQQQQRISARRRWSPRAFAIVMQNFVAGLKCPIAPSPTPLTQNNNNNTKKKDVDVVVEDASTTAPLHHVQTMWLTTLAHHLRYAQRVGTSLITHDDARNIMMEEPLSSLHVLYHALLQAFVGRRQQPAKRTRDQQQQQQRGGDASSSCAPRSATALIMAIKDVMSGDDQSSLDEWMQSLCAAPEKRDDGVYLRKRLRGVVAMLHASRSTSVNVKKMKFSCSGMVSLWVLHQIHDEWHANNNNRAKGRRGDDASGTTPQQHHGSSSSSSWLLEVMGAYQRAISQEPSPSSETELLERMTQHMLQASSSSHDASTSSPCQSAAASTYVVEALAAVCAALNALTADAAPSALFSLLHRLLHDSIPSPHTMQRWLYGQSSATTTTTKQDVREEAQQMGYLLLLHAAHILQELGNVAGLRSAARKPHMKRLCWAVAQPWVRAMRHQLLQHNNNNNSTSSLASPRAQQLRAVLPATIELHQLWSRVLQLCCSPTLYAEPDFADAVWRFLTTVLAAGAGSTNTNNNSSSSGENNILITNKNDAETSVDVRSVLLTHEMEAVLRLLNHSWLGGGARHGVEVLWVHPAMTSSQHVGGLVFHVVRSVDEVGDEDTNTEAEHSRPRPRKSGQHAATHPSSSSSSSRRSGVALRRMALAAATASMFQVSARFVHIFTRFSSDLDDLSSDFLQFLRRQHLPAHSAAATTHEDENTSTLADLVFASVGEEEGRALLREAAARVEEEDGVAGAERLVERRHIFNVEA